MRYVLFPVELPDMASLAEALRWVTFNEYPIYRHHWPFRVNPLQSVQPPLKAANRSFSEILEANTWQGEPVDPMTEVERARQEGEQQARLDQAKTRLLTALNTGKLPAKGRFSDTATNNPGDRSKSDYRYWDWDYTHGPSVQVPPDFWIANAIYWDNSEARSPHGAYRHIEVETAHLFEVFPEAPAIAFPAEKRGDVILSRPDVPPPAGKGTRGRRPEYPWDAAFGALAKRIARDSSYATPKAAIGFVMDYLERERGKVPDERDTRGRVTEFLRALGES